MLILILSYLKTLIFIFYAFTLIFGQLRDLQIHNSSLFKYEQYAIVLIIAIDRIVNSFTKEFTIAKFHMKRKKEQSIQAFLSDILNERKKQFELLLRINSEYNIENLDLWENTEDSVHPQTKLLHLYILLNALSPGNRDYIDELFIFTGKSIKKNFEVV